MSLAAAASGTRVADQLFGFRDQIAGDRADDMHAKHEGNIRSAWPSHR